MDNGVAKEYDSCGACERRVLNDFQPLPYVCASCGTRTATPACGLTGTVTVTDQNGMELQTKAFNTFVRLVMDNENMVFAVKVAAPKKATECPPSPISCLSKMA